MVKRFKLKLNSTMHALLIVLYAMVFVVVAINILRLLNVFGVQSDNDFLSVLFLVLAGMLLAVCVLFQLLSGVVVNKDAVVLKIVFFKVLTIETKNITNLRLVKNTQALYMGFFNADKTPVALNILIDKTEFDDFISMVCKANPAVLYDTVDNVD